MRRSVILISLIVFLISFIWLLTTNSAKTRRERLPGSNFLSPEIDRLLQELEDFNQRHAMFNVPRKDGILLRMLVEMSGAKNALEIGTSNGYSAIWIGSGLKITGGHLTTIEILPEKVKMARENFKKAGLSKVVTVIEGNAFKVLPDLEGPFDFVFLDAGKSDYYDFFKIFYPKVKKGGIIAAHNAISFAGAMRDYLDAVSNHPDLETVIVSVSYTHLTLPTN